MFEYISGKLTIKKIDYAALDINGLAYKVYVSLKTFEKLDNIGNRTFQGTNKYKRCRT